MRGLNRTAVSVRLDRKLRAKCSPCDATIVMVARQTEARIATTAAMWETQGPNVDSVSFAVRVPRTQTTTKSSAFWFTNCAYRNCKNVCKLRHLRLRPISQMAVGLNPNGRCRDEMKTECYAKQCQCLGESDPKQCCDRQDQLVAADLGTGPVTCRKIKSNADMRAILPRCQGHRVSSTYPA